MRRHAGFTLIELLLASALLAMLMVGVLAVVASVVRPTQALARDDTPDQHAAVDAAVLRVMRDDLSQAVRIETGNDGITLVSYGGLDPRTRERTQRPVRVRYQSVTINGRAWLVRREAGLDRDAGPSRVDWVATPVTRLQLVPPPEPGPEAPRPIARRRAIGGGVADTTAGKAEADTQSLREGLWRLRLWTGDDERPSTDTALILRASLAE